MITNLDKLHDTVSKDGYLYETRREGRTFSACHNLMGLFEVLPQGSIIIWPIPQYKWIDHILPMVFEVAQEHELNLKWDKISLKLEYGKSVCKFITNVNDLGGILINAVVNDLGEFFDYAKPSIYREVNEMIISRMV